MFYTIIKYFLIPIVTLYATLFIKLLSRVRQDVSNEDRCVGFDIIIGCIFLLIIQIVDIGSKAIELSQTAAEFFPQMEKMIWLLGIYIAVILPLSYFIRKYGWENNNTMKKSAANIANIIGVLAQWLLMIIIK